MGKTKLLFFNLSNVACLLSFSVRIILFLFDKVFFCISILLLPQNTSITIFFWWGCLCLLFSFQLHLLFNYVSSTFSSFLLNSPWWRRWMQREGVSSSLFSLHLLTLHHLFHAIFLFLPSSSLMQPVDSFGFLLYHL